MFLVILIQIVVIVLLMVWMLKQKGGKRFSKKVVWRFILFGALAYIVNVLLGQIAHVQPDMFFGLKNPLLAGFLTAFLLAALLEEGLKYIFFVFAARKQKEVVTRHDAVLAAILLASSFSILEDIQYTFSAGGGSVLRALLPAHLVFQGVMGYYYGKAKTTGKTLYYVLSLAVPILLHTLYDSVVISVQVILGDVDLTALSEEAMTTIPNYEYLIPLLVAMVLIMLCTVVGVIVMFVKIKKWNQTGQLQEPLEMISAAPNEEKI